MIQADLFGFVPWYERPFAALDFETTSIEPFTARPVSVTYVIVDSDDRKVDGFSALINSGVDCGAEATSVHGITNADIQSLGVAPQYATRKIVDLLSRCIQEGLPLCIMNARFDWTLLLAEFMRQGVPPIARAPDLLDPAMLDKGCDKFRKGKRKLTDLCAHYGVSLGDDAHSSFADALATAQLTRTIIRTCEKVRAYPTAASLRTYQADVFEEYRTFLCRDGRWTIPRGWPIPQLSEVEYKALTHADTMPEWAR